jgi:hypothetical protein
MLDTSCWILDTDTFLCLSSGFQLNILVGQAPGEILFKLNRDAVRF